MLLLPQVQIRTADWPCKDALVCTARPGSQEPQNALLLCSTLPAGPGEPLFDRRLVLHRSHTFLAPLAVSKKEWDTCKPLKPYFSRLHRVILVDDDRWAGWLVGGWLPAACACSCHLCQQRCWSVPAARAAHDDLSRLG